MSISKAQWADIEQQLKGFYVNVKFTLSGHQIAVQKVRYKENQYTLRVYIDGVWKGLWMSGDKDPEYDPIVKQVWRRRTRAVYSPSKKAELVKGLGKRRAKEYFSRLDDVIEYWNPDFKTAASLVRQFKKIDDLALVAEPVNANA
ncbi:hypothetical protein [Zhongshania sp.]|jgi:hypothetical protein|uniref:hypothetical protein n=1 Tax=Zhongshania sp. TaxID=1971902 RepID=UPI002A7F3ED3|nr:hypothetical protein [Zhongshania sp.]